MKLYNVPRNTWVRTVPGLPGKDVPPGAPTIEYGERIFFDHLDGMYSFCRKEDGTICHLAVWQDVMIDENQENPK